MNDKKAMIIEDNEDLRELMRFAFEDAGYEVMTSENGLLGITEIVEFMPTLVILDIMMPEMNGYDFLKALKNNTSIRVPVVVVSNLTQERDKERALEAGADLFLVKAEYDTSELVRVIEDHFSQRGADTVALGNQSAAY